jgi:NAD-dependent SIR2 family protein deacetylase
MVLSARFVKNPRGNKLLICDWCEKNIMKEHIMLYGMAEVHEKPCTLRLHVECIQDTQHPKIKAAVTKREK